MYEDDYGILVTKEWDKHKKYILETVLVQNLCQEGFSATEVTAVMNDRDRIYRLIEVAALSVPAHPENLDIANVATGVDYERHCAAILEAAGWTTKLTQGSGDQGVDIVAVRHNWRVVLQCKFYHGQPVGNKAVQEVISARLYERAKAAAVVSNASFTKSARQLANSGKVLLLHHDELSSLEQRLKAPQAFLNAVS
ncbi:MAG: restriction endonuclease [Hyphomicrobiales bacterium]|nr:restriction endonuclease [Hyphomicrobiales bacterium]